jgi:hypothetical protein
MISCESRIDALRVQSREIGRAPALQSAGECRWGCGRVSWVIALGALISASMAWAGTPTSGAPPSPALSLSPAPAPAPAPAPPLPPVWFPFIIHYSLNSGFSFLPIGQVQTPRVDVNFVALRAYDSSNNWLRIEAGPGQAGIHTPSDANQVFSSIFDATNNAIHVTCISGCGGVFGTDVSSINATNQKVVGFNSIPLSTAAPANGQVYQYSSSQNQWVPVAMSSFVAGGDLTGSPSSQTVAALQGKPLAASSPNNNQVLSWNGSAWTPVTPATGAGTGACGSNQFVTGVNLGTSPNCTQPAFSSLSGAATAAQLPAASSSAQGAVKLAQDLSGSATAPKVAGLQGNPVASTAPTSNQVLTWNGTAWAPANASATGAQIAQDLGGSAAAPKVVGLQGNPISSTAPTSNQILTWNGAAWVPTTQAPGAGIGTCSANQFMTGVVQGSPPNCTQPTFASLSGTATAAQLPAASSSAQGAVQLAQDLTGSATTPKVAGLQGNPVSSTLPTSNQALTWNGTAWAPMNVPATGAQIAQDLGGTTASPKVVGLQGNPVASTVPASNQFLGWNGTQWAPSQPSFSNLSGAATSGQLPPATSLAQGAVQLAQDLTGSATTPKVAGLQGNPVSSTLPTSNQVLTWNGTNWAPATPAATGAQIAQDLGGSTASPKVVGLQGNPISSTTPTSGQCLSYNGTQWAPTACASGAGAAGGSTSQIQFNNNGSFGGATNFTYNNSTGSVSIAPASSQDAVALALAPSISSPTADVFQVYQAGATPSNTCATNAKCAFAIQSNGNLFFGGNNATYGAASQTTQSWLRLYGSVSGSTNLAPPYFQFLSGTGSTQTSLFSSITQSGTLCAGSSIPSADCGPGQQLVLNPMTTAGDLIVGGSASLGTAQPNRLGIGSVGQCLQVLTGPTLGYGSCGSGTVTSVGLSMPAGFTVTASPVTTSGTLTVTGPLTTEGDLPYYHSSAWARLGVGASGQCLTSNGTDPLWASCGSSVTSVGLSLPTIFSVSGSPVTASGTLSAALTAQGANLFFAGPSTGSAAAPSFRGLAPADVALTTEGDLLYNYSGALARLGVGTSGQCLTSNGTDPLWGSCGSSVTSVSLSLPSIFSVSGTPVTSTGTLTGTLATQGANLVWAGPASGVAAAPSFRSLVKADQYPTTAYTDQANTWTAGAQDMSAAVSFRVPVAAGLIATVNGQIGYDSTANVPHMAVNSADAKLPTFTGTPTTGDCVQWISATQIGDQGSPCGSGGGGASALSSLTAATASATLANGNSPLTWNWAQTTASQSGITFGETSAATGAGDNEVKISTQSNSTATPLNIAQGSITNTTSVPTINLSSTWNNASLVGQGIQLAVTNTSSSSNSTLLNLLAGTSGTTSEFSVAANGAVTSASTVTTATFEASAGYEGGAGTTSIRNQCGQDANANTTACVLTVRGADILGGSTASTLGGHVLIRGANNASTGTSPAAGGVEIGPGQDSGAASEPLQGLYAQYFSYVKGSTVTQWNVECFSAAMTTADCGASPGNWIGVAEVVGTNTVQVVASGQAPFNSSNSATVGDTFCAGSTAGKGTDSGGTAACAVGTQIGIVAAVSGTYKLPDGTGFTASTSLPLIQIARD